MYFITLFPVFYLNFYCMQFNFEAIASINDVLCDRDDCIKFWGQKIKVQGHGMTECITDFHVSTISSPVCIDIFLRQTFVTGLLLYLMQSSLENGKLKMQIFCCSLLYNPLQRYTRSLEIKGQNPDDFESSPESWQPYPRVQACRHCT